MRPSMFANLAVQQRSAFHKSEAHGNYLALDSGCLRSEKCQVRVENAVLCKARPAADSCIHA